MNKKYTNTVFDTPSGKFVPEGYSSGLSFRTIGFALFCITALPILLAFGLGVARQKASLDLRIESNLQSISGLAFAHQTQYLDGTRQLLGAMAQARSLRDGNWTQCEEFSKRLNQELDRYSVIGVHDLNGDVVCSSKPSPELINIAHSSFFKNEIKLKDFSVGYLVPKGEASGLPILPVSRPLYSLSGQLLGFVFVTLDTGKISESLAALAFPPGFEATLLDSQGTVLGVSSSLGKDQIGHPFAHAAVLNAISAGISGRLKFDPEDEQIHDLKRVAAGSGTGLYILTTARVSEIHSPLRNRITTTMVALFAFFLAMTGLIYAAGAAMVVSPIRKILAAIENIGRNEYAIDVKAPMVHVRELQQLREGLAALSSSLERRGLQRTEALAAADDAREEMLGILDRMGDGFMVLDRQWKIRFENRSASRVFRHQRDSISGLDFWSLLSCSDLRKIREEAKQQIRLKYDWSTEDYHENLGRWLEVRMYPSGDSVGVFVRDTTEKRSLLEKLRERDRQNNELFASNPHPMAVYEAKTMKIMAANGSVARMCGYSEQELLSRTMMDIAPAEDEPLVRDLIRTKPVRNSTNDRGLIWRVECKDGRVILVEVAGHRFEFMGRDARMIMLTDVSDRLIRENRQRMEIDELKRTVKSLNDHIGRRDYLRGLAERLASDTRQSLHVLRGSEKRGSDYVAWDTLEDQLRLLGQIAWAKGREVKPQMVDLSALAQTVASALAADSRYSGTSVEISPRLQCFSDPRIVEMLLENLLACVLQALKGLPSSWVSLNSASAHQSNNIFRLTVRCADYQALHQLQLIGDPAAIATQLGNFSTADVRFRLARTLAQMLGGAIRSEPQVVGVMSLLVQVAAGAGRPGGMIQDVVLDAYADDAG